MPQPPAAASARYRTYTVDGCNVHLAVGDILDMEPFDVIVNSENNYMQMARHYEYTTISSRLRRLGALTRQKRIFEDTLQDDLNAQLKAQHATRPVELTSVYVTRAGHRQSELRRHARFVFHVATVRLSAGELDENVNPISINGVKEAVRNALDAALELNRTQAADVPSGDGELPFEPIRSIIFPMIGAGQAGRSIEEVTQPIAEAVLAFIKRSQRDRDFTLTDIFLSAYTARDADELEQAMRLVFTRDN